MRPYIVQRLLSTIPVMWGVVTLCFVILRVLPGDPTAVLAAQAGGTGEDAARLRAEYGLDRPLLVQYLRFVWDLVRGDLGRSLYAGQPVSQIIAQQAPATISLACAALVVAVVVGLPLGVAAAVRQGTWVDVLCMGLSSVGVSVPITLSGLGAILVFALTLRWLPATGQGTIRHLVLPAAVMGLASAGSIARLVRTELVDALSREYVMVARAKGRQRVRSARQARASERLDPRDHGDRASVRFYARRGGRDRERVCAPGIGAHTGGFDSLSGLSGGSGHCHCQRRALYGHQPGHRSGLWMARSAHPSRVSHVQVQTTASIPDSYPQIPASPHPCFLAAPVLVFCAPVHHWPGRDGTDPRGMLCASSGKSV